jgi:hypothetical protein
MICRSKTPYCRSQNTLNPTGKMPPPRQVVLQNSMSRLGEGLNLMGATVTRSSRRNR